MSEVYSRLTAEQISSLIVATIFFALVVIVALKAPLERRRRIARHNKIIDYFGRLIEVSFDAGQIKSEAKLEFDKKEISSALAAEVLSSDEKVSEAAKVLFVLLAHYQSLPSGTDVINISLGGESDIGHRLVEGSEPLADPELVKVFNREIEDRTRIVRTLSDNREPGGRTSNK